MKVLVFGAAMASLFGVSNTNITFAPEDHGRDLQCHKDLGSGEDVVTSADRFLCEVRTTMPYDSLECFFANLEIAWGHKHDTKETEEQAI